MTSDLFGDEGRRGRLPMLRMIPYVFYGQSPFLLMSPDFLPPSLLSCVRGHYLHLSKSAPQKKAGCLRGRDVLRHCLRPINARDWAAREGVDLQIVQKVHHNGKKLWFNTSSSQKSAYDKLSTTYCQRPSNNLPRILQLPLPLPSPLSTAPSVVTPVWLF